MNSRRMWFVILFLAICGLPLLWGCGGGGGGGGGGGAPANPAFNGTFRGDLTSTQGGQRFTETTTVTQTVGSPLSGTVTSDSQSGTISGDATGNTASFTTTFNGGCPGSSEGTATLVDDNTLSVNTSGSDCGGQFTTTGILNRVNTRGPIPSSRGVYAGTITETHTNCVNPTDNRTFSLPVTVDISSERPNRFLPFLDFSGTFTAEGTIQGANVRISGTLDDGRKMEDESVSGTYTSNLFVNGTLDSSGEGTFSGIASFGTDPGMEFDISYSGMDVVGDSCDVEGSITVCSGFCL